jgi:acyl transferase domain-containing protein/4'-phosphopantetheinyl transferase EntD
MQHSSQPQGRPTGREVLQEDIAIVGMDCIFPGSADRRAYWRNIVEGRDLVGLPPPEWGADLYYDPESGANDRIYTKVGGFLGELARFDPLKYGVVPTSIDGGEPDQFLAVDLVHRALEDAAFFQVPVPGDRVEIVLGRGTYINRGFATVVQHGVVIDRVLDVLRTLHPEHSDEELAAIKAELKASLPPFNPEMAPGLVPNLVTGRVANRLDFQGVNYIIDAACASSLIATDRGMDDLRAGRCDLAVVGGVHASTPPPIYQIFCQLGAISRRGEIRPFDRDADGTLLAEGLGILILKRLGDAQRAGDRIYALLKSVGTASDGRAVGLLAPRLEGETLALRRAYDAAGIDPLSVGLIEAHGTGTTVGDATEVAALKTVFGSAESGRPWCALGTVKSMIGHCLPAAGAAAIIKTALALHHKTLPPTLHCEHPNPELELDASAFYISAQTRPWIHGRTTPRRAGVNAFGFGGINAHLILEEYQGPEAVADPFDWPRPSELLVVEAESRGALAERARSEAAALAADGDGSPYADARRLCTGLGAQPWRVAVVAASRAEAGGKLERAAARLADERCGRIRSRDGVYFFAEPLYPDGKVAFLFPGEGSQYRNMLAGLCLHFPLARAWFDRIDRALRDHPRGLLPSEVIFPPPAARGDGGDGMGDGALWRMDIGPEAVFAANQAMYSLLEALAIRPAAMLGHSTGEYSALYAAGASRYDSEQRLLDDILALNLHYEQLEQRGLVARGSLIGVAGLGLEAIAELVAAREDLHWAMDNCPHQQVVCALTDSAAAWLRERLDELGGMSTPLPFDRAYHTPAFQPFCDGLEAFFERLEIATPGTPIYSCLTAAPMPDDPAAIRRLAIGQWAGRVRFRETVERMYADGVRLFVECGPRNNLTAFVDDVLKGRPHLALPSDLEHQHGVTQLMHLLAQLAAQGVRMDLTALYPQGTAAACQGSVRPSIPIKTGLQPLHLSRPARERAPARPAEPQPPAELAALTELLGMARLPDLATGVGVEQGALPAVAGSDAGAEVLGTWLGTMSSFLHCQQRIMESYLGETELGEADSGNGGPAASPADQRPLDGASAWPMLGTVDELEPGVRLSTRVRIDTGESLYLADHTIGRDISRTDPELGALPVVPLTFSMELMAEAAAAVMPGFVVVGMREVRAYQWIALDRGEIELLLHAEPIPGEQAVRVTLRQPPDPARDPRLPAVTIIEGDILLASERPPAPVADALRFRAERPSRWHPEDIYREIMFHGPRLRAIASMDLWGEDGSEGTFVGMDHGRLFRSTAAPVFQTDAITLDAAGQLIGMWTADHLPRGFHVFPFRMESLRIFGPNLAPGERARCRARIALVGDTEVRSDIELIRADGTLQQRIGGWWDKRFDLPTRFFHLRREPASQLLAEPRPDLLCDQARAAGLSLVVLDDLPPELLTSSGQIWLRVLAHLVLGRNERATWQEMTNAAVERRIDWLLGRVCAKDAVRVLMGRRMDAMPAPAEIEVVLGEDGHPFVAPDRDAASGAPPHLSIAHAARTAVALAGEADACLGVGIDIEGVESKPDGFTETAFSPAERALISSQPQPERATIVCWCTKEAVAKALHRGLPNLLREVEVRAMDAGSGLVEVHLRGDLRAELERRGAAAPTVVTRDLDASRVLAIAVLFPGA